MRIKIEEATKIINESLVKMGFSANHATIVADNLIAAELAGRHAHGLNKILIIKKVLNNKFDKNSKYFDYIDLKANIEIIKQSSSHLYIDAQYKTGWVAIKESLDLSLPLAKNTAVFTVSIKNLGFASGYIGAYASEVCKQGLIYIGFHNSSGGLNYFNTKEDPLGTNPITIGIPNSQFPVIVDTSMAKLNWSDIEKAKADNKDLPLGVAIDKDGNDTTDSNKAYSVKSIEGYKGTALAYGVELLAGALSGSRVDFSNFGGWGSTYIIINPEFFIGINKFKDLVANSIAAISKLSNNVYIPGQKLGNKIKSKAEEIEISDDLLGELKNI